MPKQYGRLVISPPGEGRWNMALDQAILDQVQADGVPVLRFYAWSEPTLSLGYFQSLSDRNQHSASSTLPIVRRSTGGGAIVHDQELTYSLCLPLTDRFSSSLENIYGAAHDAIIRAFAEHGIALVRFADSGVDQPEARAADVPFLCFQRRTADDLVLSGYKLVGSAQRRSARALLQHGSILLCTSPFAPELPGTLELVSRAIAVDNLRNGVAQHLSKSLSIQWETQNVEAETLRHAKTILEERFWNRSWNERRP